MPREKRIHHYIPQWYLKRFTEENSDKPHLFCINLNENKKFRATTRRIGAERDFNRFDHLEHDPNWLEDELADRIEGPINKAIQEMEEIEINDKINNEHKERILELVALLAIRTPGMREHASKQIDHMHKEALKCVAAMPTGSVVNDNTVTQELKDFIKNGDFDVVTSREAHISRELNCFNSLLPLLHKRKWSVYRTTCDVPFITSDSPVMLLWMNGTDMGMMAPGYGLSDTLVVMPLSKSMILFGAFELNEDERYVGANKELVASVNTSMLYYSHQFIYSANENFIFKKVDGELSSDINEIMSMES